MPPGRSGIVCSGAASLGSTRGGTAGAGASGRVRLALAVDSWSAGTGRAPGRPGGRFIVMPALPRSVSSGGSGWPGR
jgi:hypothetical protein